MKLKFTMPESAGCAGKHQIDFPSIPRIGEYIKDANNRYYRVEGIAYTPFDVHLKVSDEEMVEIFLSKSFTTNPLASSD